MDHSADMEIFDGLLRSVLFHLMEMGCHSVEFSMVRMQRNTLGAGLYIRRRPLAP